MKKINSLLKIELDIKHVHSKKFWCFVCHFLKHKSHLVQTESDKLGPSMIFALLRFFWYFRSYFIITFFLHTWFSVFFSLTKWPNSNLSESYFSTGYASFFSLSSIILFQDREFRICFVTLNILCNRLH